MAKAQCRSDALYLTTDSPRDQAKQLEKSRYITKNWSAVSYIPSRQGNNLQ